MPCWGRSPGSKRFSNKRALDLNPSSTAATGGGDELTREELAARYLQDLQKYFHDPEDEVVPPEFPNEFQFPDRAEDIYAPQSTRIDTGCFAKCFPDWNFRHIMSKFRRASRYAEAYWDQADFCLDQIREVFKFHVLPQKVSIMTEISSQLWALAYCHKDIISGEDEDDPEDLLVLCTAFANIILEAEKVVTILQHFMNSLNELISQCLPYINHMTNVMIARLIEPDPIPKPDAGEQAEIDYADRMNEKLKTPVRRLLLCRKTIEFQRRRPAIQTYMRMGWQRRWYTMDSFPKVQKLRHVCDSLARITFDVTRIGGYLTSATEVLDRGKHSVFDYDFLPQIKAMHKNFLKLCFCEKKVRVRRCKNFLIPEIKNAGVLVHSLDMHGRIICAQILEMVSMAHLCYDHIVRKTGGYMTFETIIQEKLDEHYVESNVPNDLRTFYADSFFKTRYSDVLRKLPAGFNNAEICLHLKTPTELRSTIKQLQLLHRKAKQLRMKRWPWNRLNVPTRGSRNKSHFQRRNRNELDPEDVLHLGGSDPKERGHHRHHRHKGSGSKIANKRVPGSPVSTSQTSIEIKSMLISKSASETSLDNSVSSVVLPIAIIEETSGRNTPGGQRVYHSKRRSGGMIQDQVDKKKFEKATRRWKRKLKQNEEEAKKNVEFPKLSFEELQRRAKAYKEQKEGHIHTHATPGNSDHHHGSNRRSTGSGVSILPYTPWWHPKDEVPAMPPHPNTSGHSNPTLELINKSQPRSTKSKHKHDRIKTKSKKNILSNPNILDDSSKPTG